ncbi:unnamed protein product [Fraxinus pennsylvanica]|uniref:Uncharacterized protein n=1 Tax=Fraxinus pennsylvanica TaxID=56036 RepID=A0AAD2AE92_9LAMI|nr:unnamed protein product [Fraxinus pennsylvanica]
MRSRIPKTATLSSVLMSTTSCCCLLKLIGFYVNKYAEELIGRKQVQIIVGTRHGWKQPQVLMLDQMPVHSSEAASVASITLFHFVHRMCYRDQVLRSYHSEINGPFPDVRDQFRKNFRLEYQNEKNLDRGTPALKAYDSIIAIAEAVTRLPSNSTSTTNPNLLPNEIPKWQNSFPLVEKYYRNIYSRLLTLFSGVIKSLAFVPLLANRSHLWSSLSSFLSQAQLWRLQ